MLPAEIFETRMALNPFPGKKWTPNNFENLVGGLFVRTYYITKSFWKKCAENSDTTAWVVNCICINFSTSVITFLLHR